MSEILAVLYPIRLYFARKIEPIFGNMAKHCDGFLNVMGMCWVTEINNFAFIFY